MKFDINLFLERQRKRFDTPLVQVYGYNAVDHSHNWKEMSSGDAYCPMCGLYRSQIQAIKEIP